MDNDTGREQWGSRLGFIMAAIGSAVGLGNIWRFPYLTAESGGASFVVLYIVLLFIVGIPVMIGEFVIGRGANKSPVQALSQSGEKDWSPLGYLFVLTGFGILSYYSVVAGWTLQYMIDSFGGVLLNYDPGTYFGAISTGTRSIVFHFLFMAITTAIVISGVQDGIENAVKLLIPLLVVLVAGLGIWAFSREGSMEGYSFYLAPDPDKLFQTYEIGQLSLPFINLDILGDAAGQTFFTLSLGMGAMITYASYLSSDEDLIEETLIISFSNFGIAFLAGLTVFPIITAYGLMDQIKESSVSTLFIALPQAFQSIGGTWGMSLSFVFFGCLFLAALTSGISLLEVVTSTLIDEFDVGRQSAAITSAIAIFLIGLPAALNTAWLSMADTIAGNLLLMLGGFMLAIYVGWLMKDPVKELKKGLRYPSPTLWYGIIRYVAPIMLIFLLLTSFWEFSQSLLQTELKEVTGG